MSRETTHQDPHHDHAERPAAPHYVAARVQQALAEDERTNELGIHVDVRGDLVFLRGQVTDEERLYLLTEVATEAAAGLTVYNEVGVIQVRDVGQEEAL